MQVIKFIEQAVAEHAAGVMPCTKTVVQSGSTHGIDEAAAAAPAPLADTPATGQLPPAGSGVVSLPLSPDPDRLPRQRVDFSGKGKACRTEWAVLEALVPDGATLGRGRRLLYATKDGHSAHRWVAGELRGESEGVASFRCVVPTANGRQELVLPLRKV